MEWEEGGGGGVVLTVWVVLGVGIPPKEGGIIAPLVLTILHQNTARVR
jgi:hypothetical protein